MNNLYLPRTRSKTTAGEVAQFATAGGGRIFRIPVHAFPGLWGYVYLVLVDDYRVLIDSGSGFGDSNQHLEMGLKTVSQLTKSDVSLASLTHILITHGHIDHFGGLSYIRPLTSAKIGIHELDKAVVTNHIERLSIVARRLGEFLTEAGVSIERQGAILELYKLTKLFYQSVSVDFTYEAQSMHLGPFEMLHVPGHCPGHVAIRLHDVLFVGDQVLSEITPHQSPERLMPSTGLSHYLDSLEIVRSWSKGVRLTLPGHENPIMNLESRLDVIQTLHKQRLQMVFDYLVEPHTITEVSKILFGKVEGYNVLLALEETGAHVEYLYQRSMLQIDNLEDLEQSGGLIPIRYIRVGSA